MTYTDWSKLNPSDCFDPSLLTSHEDPAFEASNKSLLENQNLLTKNEQTKKKGGPYNKIQRWDRLNQVRHLHFDLGYSALQISKKLNVHRHTIEKDLKGLYIESTKTWYDRSPEGFAQRQIERYEGQRRRLLAQVDQTHDLKSRLLLEKMIIALDDKIFKADLEVSKILNMKYEIKISKENESEQDHTKTKKLSSSV